MKKYKLGPHWYLTTIHECPVCGIQYGDKERIYGKKPANPQDRIIYKQEYDHCNEK